MAHKTMENNEYYYIAYSNRGGPVDGVGFGEFFRSGG